MGTGNYAKICGLYENNTRMYEVYQSLTKCISTLIITLGVICTHTIVIPFCSKFDFNLTHKLMPEKYYQYELCVEHMYNPSFENLNSLRGNFVLKSQDPCSKTTKFCNKTHGQQ